MIKGRRLLLLSILFILFLMIIQLYPNYLWFGSFGLNTIWIKEVYSKLTVFGVGVILGLLWIGCHVIIASRNCRSNANNKGASIQTGIPFLDQFLTQFHQLVI